MHMATGQLPELPRHGYDAANQEDLERTYVMTADLIRESAAMGYGEYRGHLEFMDLIGDQFDFNDNASRRLNEKIKNALDPAGILSPGRQGIWGGEFSRPADNPAYFV